MQYRWMLLFMPIVFVNCFETGKVHLGKELPIDLGSSDSAAVDSAVIAWFDSMFKSEIEERIGKTDEFSNCKPFCITGRAVDTAHGQIEFVIESCAPRCFAEPVHLLVNLRKKTVLDPRGR